MVLVIDLLLFAVSIAVMINAGKWVINSVVNLSRTLNVREFVVGFIIVGVATSLPELFVGVNAALQRNTDIVLGTIIGANIVDLTLVTGIAAIVGKGMRVKAGLIGKDAWLMLGAASLPVLLMLDKSLSRLDGAVLLLVFLVYIIKLYVEDKRLRKRDERQRKAMPGSNKGKPFSLAEGIKDTKKVFSNFGIFSLSLAVLFISANFVARYAASLAIDLSLPQIFIGLFIISMGTTLPELMFEVQAMIRRHVQAGVGNIIGSVVANSTLILGLSALIYPLTANLLLFFTGAIFMILIILIFIALIHARKGISINEGIFLILLYTVFVLAEFYVSSI